MATVTPAADFRDWLYLLERTTTTNETGETIETFTDTGHQVRAAIKPLTSRETIRARAAEVDTTHRVVIRYHRTIRPGWRVKWRDPRGDTTVLLDRWRVGRIEGIVETVRRRELELSVVEVADG